MTPGLRKAFVESYGFSSSCKALSMGNRQRRLRSRMKENSMAKKGKFDLNDLVHAGVLKEGEAVFFVSDPSKVASVAKSPNGEFKVSLSGEVISVHAAAQKFLGQEPPNHATQWFRTESGKTLFQLWQDQIAAE
jgi:hypothetical protein